MPHHAHEQGARMTEPLKTVVALGGNALSPKTEPDYIANQFHHTRESLSAIKHLILEGYMIQQSVQNLLRRENIHKDVISLITQVVVDRNDPEITNPSKQIGQRYDQELALSLADQFGWKVMETPSGLWQRVVPSPRPISIIEAEIIRELVDAGKIVIAAGGGGIPVYREENGDLEGFDAVVDKDLASAIVAHEIGARDFFHSDGRQDSIPNTSEKKMRCLLIP